MPLVSVILPVYNSIDYLDVAIQSILNQTLKSFELIIIDDGSNNQTKNKLSEYALIDNRIKLISLKKNKGITNALNLGINKAQGKYIARMDSDDRSNLNRFSKQINLMEKYELDICASNYVVINESDKLLFRRKISNSINFLYLKTTFTSPFVHGSVIFKKEFLKKYMYENYKLNNLEDYYLWIRILNDNQFKFRVVDEFLYEWRHHGKNLSSKFIKKNIEDVNELSEYFVKKNIILLFKFFFISLINIFSIEKIKILIKSSYRIFVQ